jgi:hypothetical protein
VLRGIFGSLLRSALPCAAPCPALLCSDLWPDPQDASCYAAFNHSSSVRRRFCSTGLPQCHPQCIAVPLQPVATSLPLPMINTLSPLWPLPLTGPHCGAAAQLC